jgi:hypothetical protein
MKPHLHKRLSAAMAWQILQHFATKQIDAKRACEWMEVSRARLYQLLSRWRRTPSAEVKSDWLYQRAGVGERSLPVDVQEFLREELRYLRDQSPYFRGHVNFAVLAEQCHQRFRKRFHRNTLRRWAIQQQLYDPKIQTTAKAHVRFEMGGIGMLFQHDSSIHAWVPALKVETILILSIDDHSRRIVGARLVPRDTAWHHLSVMRSTMETYGCPLSYYTDNAGVFTSGTKTPTQVGRALHALGVALKLTGPAQPQAKGKVEKRNDYLQRRIPFLCERYNITNLTDANKILDEQVAYFNEDHIHDETKERPNFRWKKAIEEGRSYLKPLPEKTPLDIVFGLHYTRQVKKDGRISFGGHWWDIPNSPRYGLVTVVMRPPTSTRRPHPELFVLHNGSTLAHFILSKAQRLTLN